jgi:hypothetical protein
LTAATAMPVLALCPKTPKNLLRNIEMV